MERIINITITDEDITIDQLFRETSNDEWDENKDLEIEKRDFQMAIRGLAQGILRTERKAKKKGSVNNIHRRVHEFFRRD